MNATAHDGAADPAQLLAAVGAQDRLVRARTDTDPRLVLGVWGTAQLVGFGAVAASWPVEGGAVLPVPVLAAVGVYAALVAAAVVVTVRHTAAAERGLDGPSRRVRRLHGLSWPVAFNAGAALVLAMGLAGADAELLMLLWPALTGLLVGLLYLAAAAIWQDRLRLGIGLWMIVVAVVAPFAGAPGNYVVMAVAGGGGFLLAALAVALGIGSRRAGVVAR
ncbi:hypothetical protein [Aquipuribacter sp. MA13-6]|uniref:hypothetical protein n=1 Tax=unclassified Aquipuribacter TaxID=2635084 RepID=UPI003EEFFD44